MRKQRKPPGDASADPYADYVVHPRFGQGPHFTGSDPAPGFPKVHLHWRVIGGERISNTAVKADLSRQTPATVSVTHYFDEPRVCRGCGRPFIFFAEEQKHWYEEIGFGLDSDCVRCFECRRKARGVVGLQHRYEKLLDSVVRSPRETIGLADVCLKLIEAGAFHKRQAAHVRALLNWAAPGWKDNPKFEALLTRLRTVESSDTF